MDEIFGLGNGVSVEVFGGFGQIGGLGYCIVGKVIWEMQGGENVILFVVYVFYDINFVIGGLGIGLIVFV